MPAWKRPITAAAALAGVAVLGLCGCGLEQYPDLLSSPQKLEPAAQYFQFRKTLENGDPVTEPDFLGFELYYKIYEFGDVSTVNADVAGIGTQDDLAAHRFRRLHAAGDKTSAVVRPLVQIAPADRSQEIVLTVDFTGDLFIGVYPRITDSGSPVLSAPVNEPDIRRDVNFTEALDKDFFKTFVWFEAADSDITYNPQLWIDISARSPVTLVLYVVSYGKDVLNNRELFSQPVWLGEISVVLAPKP